VRDEEGGKGRDAVRGEITTKEHNDILQSKSLSGKYNNHMHSIGSKFIKKKFKTLLGRYDLFFRARGYPDCDEGLNCGEESGLCEKPEPPPEAAPGAPGAPGAVPAVGAPVAPVAAPVR
jgi:hypothetical protein